jgi:hypothetical protein
MNTPIWGHVEYRSVIYDQELVNRGRLFEVKLIFSSFEERVRHGISQIGFHVRGYVNNLIFVHLYLSALPRLSMPYNCQKSMWAKEWQGGGRTHPQGFDR